MKALAEDRDKWMQRAQAGDAQIKKLGEVGAGSGVCGHVSTPTACMATRRGPTDQKLTMPAPC